MVHVPPRWLASASLCLFTLLGPVVAMSSGGCKRGRGEEPPAARLEPKPGQVVTSARPGGQTTPAPPSRHVWTGASASASVVPFEGIAEDFQPPPVGTVREGTGKMVELAAGAFSMGTDDRMDTKPVHTVKLGAFSIDATEVTVAAYRACVEAGACTKPDPGDRCNFTKVGRDTHPINCVDWIQADAFCAWAGKRLPTEAEWEYAARGTAGRKFPWGSEEPDDARLCWKRLGEDKTNSTCEVGTHPTSDTPEGIHDLAGNVWEWTASQHCYDYSYASCSPARVTRGGGGGRAGVVASVVRGAGRGANEPTFRYGLVGFRCARTRLP